MQCPNWSLHYLIFPEGIPLHVEPGNIFKRKAGTKMIQEISIPRQVIEEMEVAEVFMEDKDGNQIVKKVY